jgi:methylglutaconyl-CoA hydratase
MSEQLENQDLLCTINSSLFTITLNNPDKHNAFDDKIVAALHLALDNAIANPVVQVIVINALGPNFCAGADIAWMQKIAQCSEQDNLADALKLAQLMHTLYHCPKPTVAVIQGSAFGGGAGLVAACDIAIAAYSARFCFSEVTLGLIPAVISPYVINAIGERAAKWLFVSADIIDAKKAYQLQLIHYCVMDEQLKQFASDYTHKLTTHAPNAMLDCKALVNTISGEVIDEQLSLKTAQLIAKKRRSKEGQQGLQAFLNKKIPTWI